MEGAALHTHVSRDTTLTLARSSASQTTSQGALTRPDGDNAHAPCSLSHSHSSTSKPHLSGASGVITPLQATRRSCALGNSARSLSAVAEQTALDPQPGGLAEHVGIRPSSPLANQSHRADADDARDVPCFSALNADSSAACTPLPPFLELPLNPTAGMLLPTAIEPIARLRRSLASLVSNSSTHASQHAGPPNAASGHVRANHSTSWLGTFSVWPFNQRLRTCSSR